jgi:hypothetical protein
LNQIIAEDTGNYIFSPYNIMAVIAAMRWVIADFAELAPCPAGGNFMY